MDARETAELLASNRSVADKVRALDAAGYPRAEIARLLGKRYQHVRNVLEADRQKARAQGRPPPLPRVPGVLEEPARGFGGVHRLIVEADGRLRLPAEAQEALNLKPGGVLICEIGDGEITVRGTRAAWARVHKLMEPFRRNDGPLLSEEFIAEKREVAAREKEKYRRLAAGYRPEDDR